ncbi:hypothetical protein, partial [Pedobacter sp.]
LIRDVIGKSIAETNPDADRKENQVKAIAAKPEVKKPKPTITKPEVVKEKPKATPVKTEAKKDKPASAQTVSKPKTVKPDANQKKPVEKKNK